jgi:hypothetical protein
MKKDSTEMAAGLLVVDLEEPGVSEDRSHLANTA